MAICTPVVLGTQYPTLTLVNRNANPIGIVSSATEALLSSTIAIPANLMGPNDTMYIEAFGSTINDANTKNINLRIGTNSGGLANTTYAALAGANGARWILSCSFYNLGALTVNKFVDWSNLTMGSSNSEVGINFGVTNYISFSAYDSVGATSINLKHILISITKGTS